MKHRFAFSSVWDLPFSKSKTAGWLGGWQLASIFQAQTGQPFTLNLPIDANLDGNLSDRPSTTQGLIFFDGHDWRRVALLPGAKLEDFFTLRVAWPSLGGPIAINQRNGVVGRNTARGDSFINLDLALTKTFRLTERQSLDFRTEFFNLFNHANFGLPVRILDAPAFGSAVDTVNPARMVQFALKYSF